MFPCKLWQRTCLSQVQGQRAAAQPELVARAYRAKSAIFLYSPSDATGKHFVPEEPLRVKPKCGLSLNCLPFLGKSVRICHEQSEEGTSVHEIWMGLGNFIHHNGAGKSSPSYSWSLELRGLLSLHRLWILLEARTTLMAFSVRASSQSPRQCPQILGRHLVHPQHPGAPRLGAPLHSTQLEPTGKCLVWARGASWSQNRDTTSPKPAKRAFPGSFLNSFLATCHTALTWQEGLKRRQTEVACRAQCSF